MKPLITCATFGWLSLAMIAAPLRAGLREPSASPEEYALARLAMSTRAYPDAVAEYRRIVLAYPRDPRAWAELHRGLAALGEREEAKGAAAQAAELYRERIQIFPNDGSAYLGLTKALASAGQLEASKAAFAEGLERNPTSEVLLAEQKHRADLAKRLAEEAARSPVTRDYTPGEPMMSELLEKRDPRAAKAVLEKHGIVFPPQSSAYYVPGSNRLIVRVPKESHEAVEKLVGNGTEVK